VVYWYDIKKSTVIINSDVYSSSPSTQLLKLTTRQENKSENL